MDLEYTPVYLAIDEVSTGISFQDVGLLGFLSKMFDGAPLFAEQRRGRGPKPLYLPNPLVNIILGAQPGFLAQNVPDLAWNQGFIARFIMLYAGSTKKRASIFSTAERSFQQQENLLKDLNQIFALRGELHFSPEAKLRLDEVLDDTGSIPVHPRLEYYAGRRGMYLAKLATISAASRNSTMNIELEDVERAWSWLHEAELVMPQVFKYMAGASDRDDSARSTP